MNVLSWAAAAIASVVVCGLCWIAGVRIGEWLGRRLG